MWSGMHGIRHKSFRNFHDLALGGVIGITKKIERRLNGLHSISKSNFFGHILHEEQCLRVENKVILRSPPHAVCNCNAGMRCEKCVDGYYDNKAAASAAAAGDDEDEDGLARECVRCRCNNNIDHNAVANCHRSLMSRFSGFIEI